MKARLLSLLLAIIAFAPLSAQGQTVAKSEKNGIKVFDNSGEIPYRIPAIGTTKKGTLIAVGDYRYCRSDIGFGRIDLHVRTSADNGKSWGKEIAPECMAGDGDMKGHNQKAGYGDPCIVCDRKSKKIMVLSCSGYPGFFSGNREQHQGMARWYSEDEGQTWSGPDYIDEEVIYAPFDGSAYGPVRGWFVGSGKIHQSRYVKVKKYYRIYCAGSTYNGKETANWVIYSDDFGKTWAFLGGNDVSPVPRGDEPKVEELPNGNIVISSRNRSGRYFNIFSFSDKKKGEGHWEAEPVLSSSANQGLIANNGCNGEIQVLPVVRKSDGARTWLVMQSLPTQGRTKVSIFYKELSSEKEYADLATFAANWTLGLQVTEATSAYSTLTMLKDHTIGFFYEENEYNNGYDLVFKNLSVEEITNGAYSYKK